MDFSLIRPGIGAQNAVDSLLDSAGYRSSSFRGITTRNGVVSLLQTAWYPCSQQRGIHNIKETAGRDDLRVFGVLLDASARKTPEKTKTGYVARTELMLDETFR